ncbi:MAG: HEAT repeat domain-containing protein, partial [Lentisphaeraceae bacterium]|nr:HEAT repeat domain-containing protein [Lentisphaeraceae bacterium]
DKDAEVRAQAAKTIGNIRLKSAAPALTRLALDKNARTRFFAVKALGKIRSSQSLATILQVLTENNNDDAYLRDACVFALDQFKQTDKVVALLKHEHQAVRLAAVLALRRYKDARLQLALNDKDAMIVAEAVRAIYDQRIMKAMPAVANLLAKELPTALLIEGVLRRVINANLYIGSPAAADNICQIFKLKKLDALKEHAAEALKTWDQPALREGVWGSYWKVESRTKGLIAAAVKKHQDTLLAVSGKAGKTCLALVKSYGTLKKQDPIIMMVELRNSNIDLDVRQQSLLDLLLSPKKEDAVNYVLSSGQQNLKMTLVKFFIKNDMKRATSLLEAGLKSNSMLFKQFCIRQLPRVNNSWATKQLLNLLQKLEDKSLEIKYHLDVVEASLLVKSLKARAVSIQAKLKLASKLEDRYNYALDGGNKIKGHEVFKSHAAAQCMRCHKIGWGAGGNVGPNLKHIAKKGTAYLLRALVDPGADVASGYGMISVTLKSGKTVSGTLLKKTSGEVTLKINNKNTLIKSSDIKSKTKAISGMPPMNFLLKSAELRDVLAYLKSLK